MSARKTRLSPGTQWDRTVALNRRRSRAFDEAEYLGRDWCLGRIVRPHRLFLQDDVVIVLPCNGGGERQPVVAVSSKGYVVDGLYLRYAAHEVLSTPLYGEACREFCQLREQGWEHEKAVEQTGHEQKQFGPMRWVEHPVDLVGLRPGQPGARRYVVGTLRAGDAASG